MTDEKTGEMTGVKPMDCDWARGVNNCVLPHRVPLHVHLHRAHRRHDRRARQVHCRMQKSWPQRPRRQ